MPGNSLESMILVKRDPFSYADQDTAGAGCQGDPCVAASAEHGQRDHLGVQALDKNGHRSFASAVTILALTETRMNRTEGSASRPS